MKTGLLPLCLFIVVGESAHSLLGELFRSQWFIFTMTFIFF